jgi:hypothetical protein
MTKKRPKPLIFLHVLFFVIELLLLFGKTPELVKFIHGNGQCSQAIITKLSQVLRAGQGR